MSRRVLFRIIKERNREILYLIERLCKENIGCLNTGKFNIIRMIRPRDKTNRECEIAISVLSSSFLMCNSSEKTAEDG